jgi:hypothetical protein
MTATSTSIEEKRKEWLLLIEFIRRKYGEDKAQLIEANDYLNRGTKSVSQYYRDLYPTIGTQDLKLPQLLQNPEFLTNVLASTQENISEYTDIYNETDILMKSLGTAGDNMYIQCNPVDTNGNVIDETTNSFGTNTSSLNAMFEELGNSFNPAFLYSSVGLQTSISILFFILIYFIGNYMFISYPRSVIAKNI